MINQLADDILLPILLAGSAWISMKAMIWLDGFFTDNPMVPVTALILVIAWRVYHTLFIRDMYDY